MLRPATTPTDHSNSSYVMRNGGFANPRNREREREEVLGDPGIKMIVSVASQRSYLQ